MTNVYIKGKKFKSKDYVSILPYARTSRIKVVNPVSMWEGNKNKLVAQVLPRVKVNEEPLISS